jgi:hypothetical protein
MEHVQWLPRKMRVEMEDAYLLVYEKKLSGPAGAVTIAARPCCRTSMGRVLSSRSRLGFWSRLMARRPGFWHPFLCAPGLEAKWPVLDLTVAGFAVHNREVAMHIGGDYGPSLHAR